MPTYTQRMISVTILTFNAERQLARVLDALHRFDEVIVLDSHSSDRTSEIAKRYANVRLYTTSFQGFGAAHNHASSLASHDWILSIDADEVVTEPLVDEILSTPLDPNWTYAIRFCNFFRNKWIRYSGWYPDLHVRLYNRRHTSFTQDAVHERILSSPQTTHLLQHPILHYSYGSISDFLVKMERYSTLFATQNRDQRKSSLGKAIWHSVGAFFKTYFIKLGFLDGAEGFLIASYNSHVAFYKYLKLEEMHANHAHVPSHWPKGQICDTHPPI